jgi:hypothetical protein
VTLALLQLLWVAAHHGLRRRSAARDPHDAAPYPLAAWYARLWGHVHDVTKNLGHPPAPSEWTVQR